MSEARGILNPCQVSIGQADTAARLLLSALAARGIAIPEQTRTRIAECADPAQLESWASRAFASTSADEARLIAQAIARA